jgi:hypothetical protein
MMGMDDNPYQSPQAGQTPPNPRGFVNVPRIAVAVLGFFYGAGLTYGGFSTTTLLGASVVLAGGALGSAFAWWLAAPGR